MTNLQESSKAPTTSTSVANRWGKQHGSNTHRPSIVNMIEALHNPARRDSALAFLYKLMERSHENLELFLWSSFGSMWILLQQVTSVYKLLSTRHLTQSISIRASHAVGLFKCIASHPTTRMLFLRAGFLWYIDPFLEIKIQVDQPHENLRTASLDVIAGLVTIAASIIHTILKQDVALQFSCSTVDRALTTGIPARLLKQVILCCLMLTKSTRAVDALTSFLPHNIRYRDLSRHRDDPEVMNSLTHLIRKVNSRAGYQHGSTRRWATYNR